MTQYMITIKTINSAWWKCEDSSARRHMHECPMFSSYS